MVCNMAEICSIKDCGKLVLARSFCPAHYQRWRKTGDPLGSQPRLHRATPRVALICAHCGDNFSRSAKEVKRQRTERPDASVFCSLSCACTWRVDRRSPEQKAKLAEVMIAKNRERRGKRFFRKDSGFSYYLRQAAKREQELDLAFDLDGEYLSEIWLRQNGRCALSGIEISLKLWDERSGLNTASLDRISHLNGYVRGNVQFVALGINYAKNTFSDKEVTAFIVLIKNQGEKDGAETSIVRRLDSGANPDTSTITGVNLGSMAA